MNMSDEYKLTYFNYRGLAEPIRLIFKLAEVPFEDLRLEWDDEWTNNLKSKYRWGTLPVLEIGELKLSQSVTICRHLARKFSLAGTSQFDEAKCDELVDATTNLREEWTKVFLEFNPDQKAILKEQFMTLMSNTFEKYSTILKNNGGKYLVGQSLTWADIYVAYFLDFFKVALESDDILDPHPNLQKFQDEIFSIPQLKEWIQNRPITDY